MPSPCQPGFAEFHALVVADATLHAELQDAPDPDAFIARVVAAGAARGFGFEAAEVRGAFREAQATWRKRSWV